MQAQARYVAGFPVPDFPSVLQFASFIAPRVLFFGRAETRLREAAHEQFRSASLRELRALLRRAG